MGQKSPGSPSGWTSPSPRQLTDQLLGFIFTMAKPPDQDSEVEGKVVAVAEGNTEDVGIIEEEEAITEMIDTTTEDLPHLVDTMREDMIVTINMTEITTVHHGTERTLAIMTITTETGILGTTTTTGRGTGTTRTGTGVRTGTGTTGTGSRTGTTGHPGTTTRETGTMTEGMTDTPHHITTPAAVGDLHLLDLHHQGDQIIRGSTQEHQFWLLIYHPYIFITISHFKYDSIGGCIFFLNHFMISMPKNNPVNVKFNFAAPN